MPQSGGGGRLGDEILGDAKSGSQISGDIRQFFWCIHCKMASVVRRVSLLYIVTDQTVPKILCSNPCALIKTDIRMYLGEHLPVGRGCEEWFCKALLTIYIRSKNSTQCLYIVN